MTGQNVKEMEVRNMRKKRRNKTCIIIMVILCLIIGMLIMSKREKKIQIVAGEYIISAYEVVQKVEEVSRDRWIELPLTYIGSAKTGIEYWDLEKGGDLLKLVDGDLEYTISSYVFFYSEEDYKKHDKECYEMYDEDFELIDKSGKRYVMVYGRKMKWLQYNPGRESVAGGFANRVGIDWNMELEKNTVFFYEYPFPYYGYLADMSMELFVDEEGNPYWADGDKRVVLD